MIQKGNKMMHLNVNFLLPADFDGDLNDAIQAMLDYRRGEKNHKEVFEPDKDAGVFENWWSQVCTTDRPLFGEVSLSEFNGMDFIVIPIEEVKK